MDTIEGPRAPAVKLTARHSSLTRVRAAGGSRLPGLTRQGGKRTLQRPKALVTKLQPGPGAPPRGLPVTVTKTPLSPSAYTSSRLSVLMRTGGKYTKEEEEEEEEFIRIQWIL